MKFKQCKKHPELGGVHYQDKCPFCWLKEVEPMSERYWITGVQLGLLHRDIREPVKAQVVEDIHNKQFIGNYYTDEGQKEFSEKMKEMGGEEDGSEEERNKD